MQRDGERAGLEGAIPLWRTEHTDWAYQAGPRDPLEPF